MKLRNKCWLLACSVILALLLSGRGFITGVIVLKWPNWAEDAFKGKPLTDLEQFLTGEGVGLTPIDSGTYYTMTGRNLRPNQNAAYFRKGEPYSWFGFGSAVNLGIVVIDETPGGRKVVDISRKRELDSL